MRVAPLIAALVILLLLIIYIYAVERFHFRQPKERAAGITALTVLFSSDLGFLLGLLALLVVGSLILIVVLLPGCLYLLQVILFGQQRAKVMQPGVWLRRVCSRLLGASSMVSSLRHT
jgi:hypothetical protein